MKKKLGGTWFESSLKSRRRRYPWEALFVLTPSLAFATDYSVTDPTSLANAITNVDSGSGTDTITLDGNITLSGVLPSIDQTVTINGQGYTLNGNNSQNILTVTGGQLTVVNASLINGTAVGGNGYNGESGYYGGSGGSGGTSNVPGPIGYGGTGGYGEGYAGYTGGFGGGTGGQGGYNGGYDYYEEVYEGSYYVSTGKNSGYYQPVYGEEEFFQPENGGGGGGGGALGGGGAVAIGGGSASFQDVTFSGNSAKGGNGGLGGGGYYSENGYTGNGGSGLGGALFLNNDTVTSITDGSFASDSTAAGTGSVAGMAAGQDIYSAGGTLNYTVSSGTVTADIASASGYSNQLNKYGAGTLSQTGIYTGSVTVNGGTLTVGGTISGPVSVGAGGTVGGSGSLGSVTVGSGGSTYPGDPQILSMSNVEYEAGSTAQFSIATTALSAHPPVPGTDYDQVALTGGSGQLLTIDPGVTTLQLNISLATLAFLQHNADNNLIDNYFLFTLGSGTSSGQFSQLTLDLNGTDYTESFVNGTADFNAFNLAFNDYYTANSTTNSLTGGNDLALTATYVVPEPSTWALLLGGLGLLACLRRRVLRA